MRSTHQFHAGALGFTQVAAKIGTPETTFLAVGSASAKATAADAEPAIARATADHSGLAVAMAELTDGADVAESHREASFWQWLTARQQERGQLIRRKVVDHILHLGQCQLAGIVQGVRVGVAVHAAEVASASDVPDPDGLACAGRVTAGMAR